MKRRLENLAAGSVLVLFVASFTLAFGYPYFFTEEMPLEELKTRVTITKIVDGEYAFVIDPPQWQRHSLTKRALYETIEEWLEANRREATSFKHHNGGYSIRMVSRKM